MPWSGLGWDPSEWSGVVAVVVQVVQRLIRRVALVRIVFEMWNNATGARFVRVLWGGQPIKTSTPLGTLSMVPLDDFLQVGGFACITNHPRIELTRRHHVAVP
jgi:hypothetical protein